MNQTLPAADRVLILRLGAMGDVVRTLPAVAEIRGLYPGAHLAWLVEPASAGVVEASGLVDEVLVFPRGRLVETLAEADALGFVRTLRRFIASLRDRHFELAIDFHGLLKSGALAWLSKAPIRIGFARPTAREGASIFLNRRVGPLDPSLSRFDRNIALARALSGNAASASAISRATGPLLEASSLAEARLSARLRAAGRDRAQDFVLIHPGSSAGAQHKRYAPEAWARVARELMASGRDVWIASGPNRHERSLTEEIVRRAAGALVLAPETRSFDDLLALQARASVFVSVDSGPLHAASLSGVPVVQILGPTDPDQNEPWRDTPSERLRAPLPCSPCRGGCTDPACMRVIPPSAVVDAVNRLLGVGTAALHEVSNREPTG